MFFCAKLLFYCTQSRFAQLSNKAYDDDDLEESKTVFVNVALHLAVLYNDGRRGVVRSQRTSPLGSATSTHSASRRTCT